MKPLDFPVDTKLPGAVRNALHVLGYRNIFGRSHNQYVEVIGRDASGCPFVLTTGPDLLAALLQLPQILTAQLSSEIERYRAGLEAIRATAPSFGQLSYAAEIVYGNGTELEQESFPGSVSLFSVRPPHPRILVLTAPTDFTARDRVRTMFRRAFKSTIKVLVNWRIDLQDTTLSVQTVAAYRAKPTIGPTP